jgi:hypothetical protein
MQPANDDRARAISTLIGSFIIFFVSIGVVSAFGVFQEYYMMYLLPGESPSSISWIGSSNIFCYFAGSLVMGAISDRYGPVVHRPRIPGLYNISNADVYLDPHTNRLIRNGLRHVHNLFLHGILSTIPRPRPPLWSWRLPRLLSHHGKYQSLLQDEPRPRPWYNDSWGVMWRHNLAISLQKLLDAIGFSSTIRITAGIMLVLLVVACLAVRPGTLDKNAGCQKI